MSTPIGVFVDSNIIIRYLVGEPEVMALKAKAVIENEELLIVPVHILAETGFVLESFYKAARSDLVDLLILFVQRQNIRIHSLSKSLTLDALRMCRNSKRNSFADALLWAIVASSEGKQVFTFDERFISNGITVLTPGASAS